MISSKMNCAHVTEFGKPLDFVKRTIPDVPPKGALLKTLYAGVCYADTLIQQGGFGPDILNTVMGHEGLGRIEQFGSKVKDNCNNLAIGDVVMVYPWIGCNGEDCEICQCNYNNQCEAVTRTGQGEIGFCTGYMGAFSTHQFVPDVKFLVKLSPQIPKEIGAILPCSGISAYSALKKAKPAIDLGNKIRGHANVLVVGLGGLGIWAVILAKVMYPNVNLIAVNRQKHRFTNLEGIDNPVTLDADASTEDIVNKITKDKTQKVDAALDFVSSPQTQECTILSMHNQGIIINLGIFSTQYCVPTIALTVNNLTILGSKTGSLEELQEVADLVAKYQIKYPHIEIYPFMEINDVLKKLQAGQIKGRAVLKHDT